MARVLLVEDNQDFADSVALALQIDGHSVRVAYDGRAALVAASTSPPEVAILEDDLLEMVHQLGLETKPEALARCRNVLARLRDA